MRDRVLRVVLSISVCTLGALAIGAGPQLPAPSLVVHEWGTFTSIAGADGQAVQWLPLGGQQDLPCFVERSSVNQKISMTGTVRMETPVLYFYSPRPAEASVDVAFPQGVITEWYPHATVSPPTSNVRGAISWPIVAVQPGAKESFFTETAPSHYYAARQTDADPVRVGAKPEKFLFYRGVGQFQPPVYAVAHDDGGVAVTNVHGRPIGSVIYFESRHGTMTFSVEQITGTHAVLPRPSLDDASGAPLSDMKRILMSSGLYDREAQAMVDTWKDSWFEEGARLLYILPRADVDGILPLTISPKPGATARVFVGRIELMTPTTLGDVRAAITSGDRTAMLKYGRFLQPIAERLGLSAALPPGTSAVAPAAPCR